MKKVMLLNTAIGTSNIGDYIIMECVQKELASILKNSFVYEMPTHTVAFNAFSVWRNSLAVQNYASCDYKFAGGSNLLVKELLTHYPQWNINKWNSKPLAGTILVGVGAGAGDNVDSYTTKVYRQVLNHDYFHSVRDERSKEYVEKVLGLKAINTGCVTMWMLTPEFCKTIPTKKADTALITLTARTELNPNEQKMIDIVIKNYSKVYCWIQGDRDLDYFNQFSNTENIELISPTKEAYEHILDTVDLDYIGTRLHGGVYAMRHKKRAIIIAIDERAKEINACNNLNCLMIDEVDKLDKMINSEFETKVIMPFDEINRWKAQFEEFR
ncbi:MAG: polysaccharide pyruvyl transferase family protein [Eubacterium coprostanoligenes]|uniref:polysaccharide pyruvyl transferase family protein n=1 Tax=Eubacterium coprostanoligenes TaxID=290054 RepID=UPI0023527125|nr:polysaccharide pyruvyl transferase family protein [Eubacterium coprostanoligenes]MCI7264986.1 polysaccharide pyruvyl transferase family protein [Eubacterium coprostanoligenes]